MVKQYSANNVVMDRVESGRVLISGHVAKLCAASWFSIQKRQTRPSEENRLQ